MSGLPAGATQPPRVAIAGVSGFVGRALAPALAPDWRVVGLSRRPPAPPDRDGVEWRRCDLFSLHDTEAALAGSTAACFLVHSMMPSARLTQARFEDLDLLIADNFGRAAARAGLERIVYLGGLLPGHGPLSPHLRSRLEVEGALEAHGVPVTAVRAGLVVGPGGSSLRILVRLVERLPVMLTPRWTRSPTQPIALDDVVAILRRALEDPDARGRVCEVGGPDVMSYRELMGETALVLGRRRVFVPVPFFSPKLSRLWVSLVTGTPRALVGPLVESLRHPMVATDRWLQEKMGLAGVPFVEALRRALAAPPQAKVASPRAVRRALAPTARSIQRLPRPPGWDADRVAREYASWLPRFMRPALRVSFDGRRCVFHVRGLRRPLLELVLVPERSTPDRALFLVSGGLLATRSAEAEGRLEFRIAPDGGSVLAAVHDFRPRLPWWLYKISQAWVHLRVMRGFGRHLRRLARAPGQPAARLGPGEVAPDAAPRTPRPGP